MTKLVERDGYMRGLQTIRQHVTPHGIESVRPPKSDTPMELEMHTVGLYLLDWLAMQKTTDMEGLTPTYPDTLRFIQGSFRDKAPDKYLEREGKKGDKDDRELWKRDLNMLGLYAMSWLSLEEIGGVYGMTKGGAHSIVKKTFQRLYDSSSPETQQSFNVNENKKPHHFTYFSNPKDVAQGFIRILAGEDVKTAHVSLSHNQREKLNHQLHKLGLPNTTYEKIDKVVKEVGDLDDERVQKLVKELPSGAQRNFFQKNSRGENAYYQPLLSIFPGLTFNPKNVATVKDTLADHGITIHTVTSVVRGEEKHQYFVARKHLDAILNIFPDLLSRRAQKSA